MLLYLLDTTVSTQTLDLPLLSNGQTIYAPSLVYNIAVPLLSNAQAFFAPSLAHNVTVPLLSNTQAFFGPGLVHNIAVPLLSNAQTFFAPGLVADVSLPLVTNTSGLLTPALVHNVTLALFTNTSTIYAPTLDDGSALPATQPFKKPAVQLRVVKSGNARDIYQSRRYRAEARFPGGRTITLAKERTRERAYTAARKTAVPQTSPTAAGGMAYTTEDVATSSEREWEAGRDHAGISQIVF